MILLTEKGFFARRGLPEVLRLKTVTVRKATCHQLSNVCFMQEKTMSNDLITTVHDLVLESPIGAKAIAQAVGKP